MIHPTTTTTTTTTTTSTRRATGGTVTTDENIENVQHQLPPPTVPRKDWRTSTSTTPPKKSHGISPSSFHNHRRLPPSSSSTTTAAVSHQSSSYASSSSSFSSSPFKRDRTSSSSSYYPTKKELLVDQKMEELKRQVNTSLVHQGTTELHSHKKEHLSKLATKRAVFKSLTELKRWPVQDQAMEHLDQLLLLKNQTVVVVQQTNNKDSTVVATTTTTAAVGTTPTSLPSPVDIRALDDSTNTKTKTMTTPLSIDTIQAVSSSFSTPRNQENDLDSPSAQSCTSQQSYSSSSSGESSSSSSSSSSSLSSTGITQQEINAKRRMRQVQTSPGKSQLQATYRDEFYQDRDTIPLDQQDALWNMEPRIFSTEKAHGKRRYLVGHLGRILDLYWRKTIPKHFYEVIRDGVPCRLYFDMEFSIPDNPTIYNSSPTTTTTSREGKEEEEEEKEEEEEENHHHHHPVTEILLQEFRDELVEELHTQFGSQLKRHVTAKDIIDLDSSNTTKFSRHWIVHLPDGYLFPDAVAVGRFVKQFIGRLADEIGTGQLSKRRPILAKYLFVHPKPGKREQQQGQQQGQAPLTCFVDLGVYTRNRLFRVLGSSKFGKSTTLQIAKGNQFPLYLPNAAKTHPESKDTTNNNNNNNNNTDGDEHTTTQLTTIPSSQLAWEEFVAANDWTHHATALAQTMVIPVGCMSQGTSSNSGHIKILPVPDYNNHQGGTTKGGVSSSSVANGSQPPKRIVMRYPQQHLRFGGGGSSFGAPSSVRESTTPIPSLDKYVMDVLATRGGVPGTIRAWSYDTAVRTTSSSPKRGSITYQLARNRWCELIGRSHKSNNIYWTIDLESWTCIQGCHDPDCHGRGRPMTIPKHIMTILEQEYQEWQDLEFEQALLSLNLDDVMIAAAQDQKRSSNNNDNGDDNTKTTSNNLEQVSETMQEIVSKEVTAIAENETTDSEVNTSSHLSDDALLDAILSNPDLFP